MIPTQITQWQLSADALNGTGKFSDKSALVKFPRETDERYSQRKTLSFYRNFMREKCMRIAGYLSTKQVLREVNHPLLDELIDDCDLKGNSISVFMSSLVVELKARGTMLVLVDMPADMNESLRKSPYFVPILPETITDYVLGVNGKLTSLSFNTTQLVEGKDKSVTRTYTTEGWTVKDGDKVLAQGDYNLGGLCPVVAITEHGDFPCVGEFYQIAEISVAIMNKESEKNDILRNQTFSILTYNIPIAETDIQRDIIDAETAAAVESLGTNNMLTYQGERPAFVAPDASPAETIETHIQRLKADIDNIAYNVVFDGTESGVAKRYRFQDLNSALSRLARKCEDGERQLLNLACLWLGMQPNFIVQYASDYNLTDIESDIAMLTNLQAVSAPPAYQQAKLKAIARIDLAGLDQVELDQVLAQIDEASFEVAPQVNAGIAP